MSSSPGSEMRVYWSDIKLLGGGGATGLGSLPLPCASGES